MRPGQSSGTTMAGRTWTWDGGGPSDVAAGMHGGHAGIQPLEQRGARVVGAVVPLEGMRQAAKVGRQRRVTIAAPPVGVPYRFHLLRHQRQVPNKSADRRQTLSDSPCRGGCISHVSHALFSQITAIKYMTEKVFDKSEEESRQNKEINNLRT